MTTIYETMRLMRERKGLSVQEVADVVGVKPEVLESWENGEKKPNIEHREKWVWFVADKNAVSDEDTDVQALFIEFRENTCARAAEIAMRYFLGEKLEPLAREYQTTPHSIKQNMRRLREHLTLLLMEVRDID